jgi:hypothetical protein
MQRRNRKWVLLAVATYLLVMGLAYRWSVHQIPNDGPLLVKREREEVRKWKERQTREAQEAAQAAAQPQPGAVAQSRLAAAGPAFVAARYDRNHVVFVVTTDAEQRFNSSPIRRLAGTPTKVAAPARPSAPLAGLQELWEPDSQSLHFYPKIIQAAQPGDQWLLSLSADATIPVAIERTVFAPTGCSLALGFLASIPPEQQAAIDASSRDYFVVRRAPVESADPASAAAIGELTRWKPSPALKKQVAQQLTARMIAELATIDARLIANADSPGAEPPLGSGRPRIKEWLHADDALGHGKGSLDYDLRAFRLTPDGAPRIFARARWTLAGSPLFVMTAWFKQESFKEETSKDDVAGAAEPCSACPGPRPGPTRGESGNLTLLFADSSWSRAMRESQSPPTLGDSMNFQSILNEFDADHDGWAELLVHSQVPDSGDAASTAITLYLYTDQALVPMKLPFVRNAQPPENCVDR